jgi:hypothetical protein
MSDCYIGKEPFETMCCCNCRHYVKVCLHCNGDFMMLTRDKFGKDAGCICNIQIAWACAIPTTLYGHEEHSKGEHSVINLFGLHEHECGCEMYDQIFKVKKRKNGEYYKSKEVER